MSTFLQGYQPAANLFTSDAETLRLKREFAKGLALRPNAAWQVALSVFKNDAGRATYAARTWPDDVEVREMVAHELSLITPDSKFITKDELCARVLDGADMTTGKTQLDFYRFYAEVRGWIGKDANIQQTKITNNVIVVPAGQSMDTWEQGAQQQQHTLIQEAKVLNAEMTEAQANDRASN